MSRIKKKESIDELLVITSELHEVQAELSRSVIGLLNYTSESIKFLRENDKKFPDSKTGSLFFHQAQKLLSITSTAVDVSEHLAGAMTKLIHFGEDLVDNPDETPAANTIDH